MTAPYKSASPAYRHDRLITGLLVAGLFVVYALGACRTIYVGDSGELVTAVYLLGVPHPSGYPLYVMLGKLWTLLVPVGSIAFRMSLFSAACAAAAAGLLFQLARRIGLSRTASATAALVLAFSHSFWSQANIQRVYALNAVFVILAAMAVHHWHRHRNGASLALAAFLCGLGAGNHLFMGIFGICAGVFVIVTQPSILRRAGTVAAAAGAGMSGLLVYLYLPIRSLANPRLDWGNPETFENFKKVVFREDFWDRRYYEGPGDLLVVGWDYLASFGPELAWVGAGLALLGAVLGWWRAERFMLLPLLVMGANFLALAMHGSRVDIFFWHRYYIPSYIMAALLAGLGAQAVVDRLPARLKGVVLLVPGIMLVTGWAANDRSRYAISEEFSRAVFDSVPPGANLIATDDNILFTSMYLHLVEGMRPDVNLILQGVGGIQLPSLKFDPDDDPLYFTHHPNWNIPQLEIVPLGVTFRAWRAGKPWPEPVELPAHLDGELDPAVPKDHLTQNLIGQYHYMLGVTQESRDWKRAREEFRLAAEAAPDNDVLFYNLGLIHTRNGLLDRALEFFKRSHAVNPRHLASLDKPRALEKIRQVELELRRLVPIEESASRSEEVSAQEPDSAAYHLGMARTLEAMGEGRAARGHLLRAVEKGAVRSSQAPPERSGLKRLVASEPRWRLLRHRDDDGPGLPDGISLAQMPVGGKSTLEISRQELSSPRDPVLPPTARPNARPVIQEPPARILVI